MGSQTRCLCFPQHRGPPASASLPEGPTINLWPGRWTLVMSPHSGAPSPRADMPGPGPALWPAQDSPRTLDNAAWDPRPSQGSGVARNNRVAHQSTVPVETPAGHLHPWSCSSFLRSWGEHQPCPRASFPPCPGTGLGISGVGGARGGQLLRLENTHISTKTSSGWPKCTRRKQRLSSQHWKSGNRALVPAEAHGAHAG